MGKKKTSQPGAVIASFPMWSVRRKVRGSDEIYYSQLSHFERDAVKFKKQTLLMEDTASVQIVRHDLTCYEWEDVNNG